MYLTKALVLAACSVASIGIARAARIGTATAASNGTATAASIGARETDPCFHSGASWGDQSDVEKWAWELCSPGERSISGDFYAGQKKRQCNYKATADGKGVTHIWFEVLHKGGGRILREYCANNMMELYWACTDRQGAQRDLTGNIWMRLDRELFLPRIS